MVYCSCITEDMLLLKLCFNVWYCTYVYMLLERKKQKSSRTCYDAAICRRIFYKMPGFWICQQTYSYYSQWLWIFKTLQMPVKTGNSYQSRLSIQIIFRSLPFLPNVGGEGTELKLFKFCMECYSVIFQTLIGLLLSFCNAHLFTLFGKPAY